MSTWEGTLVELRGPMVFTVQGHVAPLAPVGGVLTLDLGAAGAFIVANGSLVQGIRYINRPPLEVDGSGNGIAQSCMLMLQAEDGGAFTVTHEDMAVAEPTERIDVDDGAATAIDAKRVQVFYEPWRSGGRTRVHDWAGIP